MCSSDLVTSWAVGFTPTALGSLAAGNTITVVFDSAFTVPATPTITLSAAFLQCSATGATVGTTVTVTLANSGGTCALAGLTPGTVTIAGITNPAAAVYAGAGFGVRTSKDGTTVAPGNVTIAATGVSTVTFTGTPAQPTTTAVWAVGFTSSAAGALATGNTITVTFNAG